MITSVQCLLDTVLAFFPVFGSRIISRLTGGGLDVGCDHFRSVQFFIESIAHDRTFTAFLCDNFDDFKDGMCLSSSRLENMGLDWQEQNSIQGRRDFTITRREAPFSGETGSFSYSIFTEGKNATIYSFQYTLYFREAS